MSANIARSRVAIVLSLLASCIELDSNSAHAHPSERSSPAISRRYATSSKNCLDHVGGRLFL